MKKITMCCLAGITVLALAACGSALPNDRVITFEKESERVVTLFSPMEKTLPDVDNVARSASEKTVIMAEEKLEWQWIISHTQQKIIRIKLMMI